VQRELQARQAQPDLMEVGQVQRVHLAQRELQAQQVSRARQAQQVQLVQQVLQDQ
jgi:hypothetical protein